MLFFSELFVLVVSFWNVFLEFFFGTTFFKGFKKRSFSSALLEGGFRFFVFGVCLLKTIVFQEVLARTVFWGGGVQIGDN